MPRKKIQPTSEEIQAADDMQAPSAAKKAIKKAVKTTRQPRKRQRVSLTNAGVVPRRLTAEQGKRFTKVSPDELIGVPFTILDAAIFPSTIPDFAPSMLFYAEIDSEAWGGELEAGNFVTFFLGQDTTRTRIFKALHSLPANQGLGLVTIKLKDLNKPKPYRDLVEWKADDDDMPEPDEADFL